MATMPNEPTWKWHISPPPQTDEPTPASVVPDRRVPRDENFRTWDRFTLNKKTQKLRFVDNGEDSAIVEVVPADHTEPHTPNSKLSINIK